MADLVSPTQCPPNQFAEHFTSSEFEPGCGESPYAQQIESKLCKALMHIISMGGYVAQTYPAPVHSMQGVLHITVREGVHQKAREEQSFVIF